MSRVLLILTLIIASLISIHAPAQDYLKKGNDIVRIATFNVAMNRRNAGDLATELESGNSDQAKKIAAIIQMVRPDVLLLNEFDWDADSKGLAAFREKYLGKNQHGGKAIDYKFEYTSRVNTGLPSGKDLNGNKKNGEPNDAFGFGFFEGQYAMVVLSMYPIDKENARTFQKFLWKQMPDRQIPIFPDSKKPFYSDEIMEVFRLSSKNHWDLPIKVGDKTIHFLASHPTPPVFDGPADQNGCRNFDEIKLFADYVDPEKSGYIVDDVGKTGGLQQGDNFVIAGDLNADPNDGDSRKNAIHQLTKHPLINHEITPRSEGAARWSELQGKKNKTHKGNPAFDTGDFNDKSVGNVRIDYVLPSKNLKIKSARVFWPPKGAKGADLMTASDHRMVWIDVVK